MGVGGDDAADALRSLVATKGARDVMGRALVSSSCRRLGKPCSRC